MAEETVVTVATPAIETPAAPNSEIVAAATAATATAEAAAALAETQAAEARLNAARSIGETREAIIREIKEWATGLFNPLNSMIQSLTEMTNRQATEIAELRDKLSTRTTQETLPVTEPGNKPPSESAGDLPAQETQSLKKQRRFL